MASVSSLDSDMRRLRMERFTPQSAQEVRSWIEDALGERLPSSDLLEALKDGVALCKLANQVLPPPGIKFKATSMPFTQRENISNFLNACEMPPLNLPAHDRFLTVDLYDGKDPAQVVQCIGAFSRAANSVNPSKFPNVIGPRRMASPTRKTGSTAAAYTTNDMYNKSALPGGSSPFNSTVSSWSKKSDEQKTAPAWNIHQYGYLGGASQGNQGISFGARRQIIPTAVDVPSIEEKNQRLKVQEASEQRKRMEDESEQLRRKEELAAQERRDQLEEERRWQEETRRAKDQEAQEQMEESRLREEAARRENELEKSAQLAKETSQQNKRFSAPGTSGLRGQYLSEYKTQQAPISPSPVNTTDQSDSDRIRELERQLEEARQRERQHQTTQSRDESFSGAPTQLKTSNGSTSAPQPDVDDSWVAGDERDFLRKQWTENQEEQPTPPLPTRPDSATAASLRPLPTAPRTDRFLANNAAPTHVKPAAHFPSELGMTSTSERAAEDARRVAGQEKTKAGGWASKSLLEREMERERERQREWEQEQLNGARARGLVGPREMKR